MFGGSSGFHREEGLLGEVRAIPPDDELKTEQNFRFSKPGIHTVQTGVSVIEDRRVIPLEGSSAILNSGLPKVDPKDTSTSVEVLVLPDLNNFGPEDDCMQLSCEPVNSNPRQTTLEFQIALRNISDRRLSLANSLDAQGWYMWLDENNQPMDYAGWPVVYSPEAVSKRTALDPGGAVDVPLRIAPPEKPGRYALLIGISTSRFPNSLPESPDYSGELYLKIDHAAVVGE